MEEFKFSTEGVLIIASSNALKRKYSNEEFDYNFPEGINELISQNSIIAITNSGGDNIIGKYSSNQAINYFKFDKVIKQSIELTDDDELLILSHSDFTMICDKDGDYTNYSFPIAFSKQIKQGKYIIEVAVNDVSNDFELYQAYFKVMFNVIKSSTKNIENFICELSE